MISYIYCKDPDCPECAGTREIWCPDENQYEPCLVKVESDDTEDN